MQGPGTCGLDHHECQGPLTLTEGKELWPSGASSRETLLEEMPGGGKC